MQVYLFGNFRVSTDTHCELVLRPTAARLFAFLLLHRHRVHLREVVAESFWQETDIDLARKSLNTTLWQLRQALCQRDNSQANVIAATPEQIKINQEANLWLDVAVFEKKAKQGLAAFDAGLCSAAIEALAEAVALYQGDLLESFYDLWVLQERERLRLLYLRSLTCLMAIHQQQHNLDASIEYAQHILRVEPWHEEIHRTLMTLYAKNGRRAAAIQQYQVCRHILASELDVLPMEETDTLYRQLLTNSNNDHPSPVSSSNQPVILSWNSVVVPTLQESIAHLQAAIQTIKDAQQALDRAVALVERIIPAEQADYVATLPH